MSLPMGYRFAPSDEELVSFFLKKKVTCQLHPSWNAMIVERDIYAEKSPWNVFSTKDPWVQVASGNNTKMCIYIFTTLKFLGKKRITRTAGCGTWHGETGPQEIVDKSGAIIGKKEMFSFISKDQSLKGLMGHSHWYMHEYAFTCNSGLEASEGRPMNYVICNITRDDRKKLRIWEPTKKKRNHVSDQEESNYCATASQPDQCNAKDDFLDGFSGELENMLGDGTAGSDDVACTMTTNMEDNKKKNSCSTTPLVDEFLDSFPEVDEKMLGSDDMASVLETFDEFWEGIDASQELSNAKPLFTSLADAEAFLMADDDDAAYQEGFDGKIMDGLDPEPAAKKMRYDATMEFIHI